MSAGNGQFVRIGDVELYLTSRGEGKPLLLVHGFPLDHTMWREQLATFQGHSGWRIIAPDLRGFGRSTGPAMNVVGMEQFADDLAYLLDACGIHEPVTFCGLSMGGYIAWQFWNRHRRRLARLVLCDTRAAADSPEAAQMRWQSAERVLEEGPKFLADNMVDRLFSSATRRNRPELVEQTRQVILSTKPEAIAAALRGMAQREDFTARLPNIDVPTLVVCGKEDAISPVEEMQSIAEDIPGARFCVLEDAGHMAPLENPNGFHEALRDFLNQ